jgi:hypothetical protein
LHTDSIDGAADALYGPSHVIGWGRPSNKRIHRWENKEGEIQAFEIL